MLHFTTTSYEGARTPERKREGERERCSKPYRRWGTELIPETESDLSWKLRVLCTLLRLFFVDSVDKICWRFHIQTLALKKSFGSTETIYLTESCFLGAGIWLKAYYTTWEMYILHGLGSSPSFTPHSSFLLTHTPEGSGDGHPCGWPSLSSSLRLHSSPSTSCCRHLGSKPIHRRFLSFWLANY